GSAAIRASRWASSGHGSSSTSEDLVKVKGLFIWLGTVAAFGLLLFLYHYLAVLAERGTETPWKPFIDELTGALTGGLLFFAVRALVRRAPLTRETWPRRLTAYVVGLLVVA